MFKKMFSGDKGSAVMAALIVALAALAPDMAWAMTAPAAGSGWSYTLYTLGATEALTGPLGYLIALAGTVYGGAHLFMGDTSGGIKALAGSAVVASAQSMVNGFGLVI